MASFMGAMVKEWGVGEEIMKSRTLRTASRDKARFVWLLNQEA